MVSIISFILRIVILVLWRPPIRKALFLDETFAHVSEEYLPNLNVLLKKLANELGVQIVMVSHQRTLLDAGDVMYVIKRDDKGYAYLEREQLAPENSMA